MTTKLQLYKRAALHLKHTPPASLTENIEIVRIFDVHYADVLVWLMENGYWRDAVRSVEITENTDVTKQFGFTYAHDIPSDYVRMFVVSASEFFTPPLDTYEGGTGYLIEQGYIWAEITPLYVRYVSNDTNFGYDLTKWTDVMAECVALEMAYRSCGKSTGGETLKKELKELVWTQLSVANNLASLEQPTPSQRQGRWTSSRWGRNSSEYNRA